MDKLNKVSDKILNSKIRVVAKEIRNKYSGQTYADDKTPLTSSSADSISSNAKVASKKDLKRKNSSKNDDGKHLFKKAKKEMDGLESKVKFITNVIQSERKKQQSTSKSNRNESDDELKKHKRHSKIHKKKVKNVETQNGKQSKGSLNRLSDNEKTRGDKKIDPIELEKRKRQLQKLKELVSEKEQKNKLPPSKKEEPVLTLRQKMMRKLKAARFRFLNEQIYSTTSRETEKIFRRDPEAFKAYHEGYKLQVKRWPLNPLDKIIKSLSKMSKACIIADFGCGEAKLAKSLQQKVHSFDLVAANDKVTACDMAHVPLHDSSVDVAVFCLSLMGTNLKDYFLEANRVLKNGGLLKIAEVESRIEDINVFIKNCEQFGFKKTWMDLSYNLFYFIDFRKETSIKDKKKLPSISLQPCLYKKR